MKKKSNNPTEVEVEKTDENKEEFITLECTVEEFEEIKAAAEKANLSIPEFLIKENEKHSKMLSLIDKVSNNDTQLDNEIDEMAKKFNDPQHEINENDLNDFISLLKRTAEKRSNIANELTEISKLIKK